MLQETPPETLVLNAKQVAAVFQISQQHWSNMVREGLAPAPLKLGKSTRWLLTDLREWAEQRCPVQDVAL